MPPDTKIGAMNDRAMLWVMVTAFNYPVIAVANPPGRICARAFALDVVAD